MQIFGRGKEYPWIIVAHFMKKLLQGFQKHCFACAYVAIQHKAYLVAFGQPFGDKGDFMKSVAVGKKFLISFFNF